MGLMDHSRFWNCIIGMAFFSLGLGLGQGRASGASLAGIVLFFLSCFLEFSSLFPTVVLSLVSPSLCFRVGAFVLCSDFVGSSN